VKNGGRKVPRKGDKELKALHVLLRKLHAEQIGIS
jgi:hypothetical protein